MALQRFNSITFKETFSVSDEVFDVGLPVLFLILVFSPRDLYYKGHKKNENIIIILIVIIKTFK